MPRLPSRIPQPSALAELAGLLRDCLSEVGRWARIDKPAPAARTVIVAAAAPFAPTSYARARLLRQLHASGLLTTRETEQVEQIFAATA